MRASILIAEFVTQPAQVEALLVETAAKHLLVVYHTKTGNTGQLADAALAGARHPDLADVTVHCKRAVDAGPADLLWAHGVLLGTPENFGYMSGALKDFFDRTFYEVEGKLQPLPYALFISAGNDGSGAVRAVKRIVGGYPLVEVQEPLIAKGTLTAEHLAAAETLGMTLAAGLSAGIYYYVTTSPHTFANRRPTRRALECAGQPEPSPSESLRCP